MTPPDPAATSSTPEANAAAAASTEPVEVEQMLVEEVSIDGLCGVY